ncbi:MAG: hypothetical protein ACTHOE_05765 [Conexibacter sp.]
MRTTFLLLCACCALLVPAVSASAARSRPHRAPAAPCAAKGSKTVALNPLARVYVRSERGDADQHLLIGCLLRSGQTVQLASWFSCDCSRGDEPSPQVWLRERIVAVNRWSCPPDPALGDCVGSARTVSLRTGETLHSASTGTSVAALVQGPRGSFAYVSSGGAVLKVDADGEGVLLDPGPGVAADSLAAAGAHVYWMHGAIPFAASLRP